MTDDQLREWRAGLKPGDKVAVANETGKICFEERVLEIDGPFIVVTNGGLGADDFNMSDGWDGWDAYRLVPLGAGQ